jgi:hypothetical protein
MPNVKVLEMHNVNHWPHIEEPEIFNALSNALSIEFLQKPKKLTPAFLGPCWKLIAAGDPAQPG